MVAYRQPIRHGQSGRDVTAVKRAMKTMNAHGARKLNPNNVAGEAFMACLNGILRQHGLKQDSIYGPGAHKIIARHFDAYASMLYRTAKIRKPPEPPIPAESAQAEARQLLHLREQGRYHADNSGDLGDLQRTAAGGTVWSQCGYSIHLDPRPLRLLVWLIENKAFKIGTFAFCSDHHCDGRRGHSGGLAVDISSINGLSVASLSARDRTLAVAKAIAHETPSALRPRQLICDGYGYLHDWEISGCCIPYASYYGSLTLSQHRNHIHAGF